MSKTWLKRGRSQDNADATQRAAELKEARAQMDEFLNEASKFLTENLKKISKEHTQMDMDKRWQRHSMTREIPKDVFGSKAGLEDLERLDFKGRPLVNIDGAVAAFLELKTHEVELDKLICTEVIKPVLEGKKEIEEGLPKRDYTKTLSDNYFYALLGIIGKSGANKTIVERAIFWLTEEMEDEQVAGELRRIAKEDLGIVLPHPEDKDAKRV